MANVKISGLPAATAAADANEFEINEAGTSKKVTGTQIASYVESSLGLGTLATKSTITSAEITNATITGTDIAPATITASNIAPGTITSTELASNSVEASQITDNSVGADELNVPGNGTSGQYLASDGDGTMTWTDLPSGGGFSNMEVFTSSGTWTNPGTITKVKVTVVGGGGGGANGQPLAVNASATAPDGGTSSFGAYCSATGGYGGISYRSPIPAGPYNGIFPGLGGIGSGGNLNFRGGVGLATELGEGYDKGILAGGDTYIGSGAVYAYRGPAADVTSVGYYGGGGVMRYQSGSKSATGGGGGAAIEVVTIPTSPVPITVGTGGTNVTTPASPAPLSTSLASGDGVVIVEY